MSDPHKKTEAYQRGLDGKSTRSPLSPSYPSTAEKEENARGRSDRALIQAQENAKKK